ncbi:antimicrobial ginkbilobin-2-like protein [Carex rostrata]
MEIHIILLLLTLYILLADGAYSCFEEKYTIGSTYQSNLQQLLRDLPQNVLQNNYFNNATYGKAPDQVYGLIMCNADASTAACKRCLTEASHGITESCAFSKHGVGWYDACMIRYSDAAFNATNNIGLMGCEPKVQDSKPEILAELKQFRETMRQLADVLATNASRSPLRWAAAKMNYTLSANIYALAQCTRQLPSDECRMCISDLTDFGVKGCTGDTAVQADETLKTFSCYARFALKPFYVISEAHPPWPNSGKNSREPIPIHILTIIIGSLLALLANIRL